MTEYLHRTREHRLSLRSAIHNVERSVAAPSGNRVDAWAAELAADLDVLADSLATHVKVNEAPGGLFDDIIEEAPNLAPRVDRMRKDHVRLQDLLARAQVALPCGPGDVEDVRERVVELLIGLVRHRHMGSELVYDAFNVDLEAAD